MALDFIQKNFQPTTEVSGFLSTTFPKTITPGTKTTPVVTSKIADEHITKIGDTLTQSNQDIANASIMNANNASMKKQQEDQKKQQDVENKQKETDPIAGLMSALGEQNNSQADIVASNKEANKIDTQYRNTVSNAIDSMNAGTYPLSETEKASVDNLRNLAQGAIESAEELMQSQVVGQTKRNAKYGLQMYSPQEAISNIAKRVEEGNQRITEINTRLLESQNKLTQAFKNKNFKVATSLYNKISDTIKERNDEISTINKEVAELRKELLANIKAERDREDKIESELTKTKSDVLMKLAESGNVVPQETKDAISNATTEAEAISLAGDLLYGEDEKLDAQYKQMQMEKIRNDMAVDWAKLTEDKRKDDDGKVLDLDQASAYAAEYAANGKIPTGLPRGTFGEIAKVAKELPKTPGQIISVNTGVAPAGDDAYQSGLGALYSATQLATQLKELEKERMDGILAGSLGKVFGSDKQTRYMDLRSQIVDLLSRARSGAALTPSEEQRYGDMLPGRFSGKLGLGADPQTKITNFISALTDDASNKASSKGWAINGVSKVKVGGKEYTMGDVIEVNGVKGRINADGTITEL